MDGLELARAYLTGWVARDYPAIRALLADDFRLRDLSPGGYTEVDDVDEAVAGLGGFLDQFDSVRELDSEIYGIGGLVYLRARVGFTHPERGERVLEQHHLLRFSDGKISGVDELCTGTFPA